MENVNLFGKYSDCLLDGWEIYLLFSFLFKFFVKSVALRLDNGLPITSISNAKKNTQRKRTKFKVHGYLERLRISQGQIK